MTNLTKVTCKRCGGSGHFSFNITKGTVCFGCNGSKFQLVDIKKENANKEKQAKVQAKRQAQCELMRSVYNQVLVEMNGIYGKFNIDTELGIDLLNKATAQATGRSLTEIRDERVKAIKNGA